MTKKTILNVTQDELDELLRDKARLDFLEEQGRGRGTWIARESETGRGYRLHNTSRSYSAGARETPREAIDAAMERS